VEHLNIMLGSSRWVALLHEQTGEWPAEGVQGAGLLLRGWGDRPGERLGDCGRDIACDIGWNTSYMV
jgi:hypothetical protein